MFGISASLYISLDCFDGHNKLIQAPAWSGEMLFFWVCLLLHPDRTLTWKKLQCFLGFFTKSDSEVFGQMDASLPNRSSKNIGPFIQWMPHVLLFCDQIPFGTDPLDKPREIKGVRFASHEDLMDFQSLLVKSGVLATGAPWSCPVCFQSHDARPAEFTCTSCSAMLRVPPSPTI